MKKFINFTMLLVVVLSLVSCGNKSKSDINVPTEYCEELVKLAEDGNAEAQFILAKCYAEGEGVEKNDDEANKWIRKAAELGNLDATNEMGDIYLNGYGSYPINYDEAFKWYQKAAEQGHAMAQSNLGVCYERGVGTKKDHKQAFNWITKAAKQGNIGAQFFLGDYYRYQYTEAGISHDEDEAFKWYSKAAEQGEAHAQAQVALSYYMGLGTSKDVKKAIEWNQKAIEQDNATAMYNLGYIYMMEYEDTPENTNKAFDLIKRAASLGNKQAIQFLQKMGG